jgi:hypothetical protein
VRIRRAVKVLDSRSVCAQPISSMLVKRLAKWPDENVDVVENDR